MITSLGKYLFLSLIATVLAVCICCYMLTFNGISIPTYTRYLGHVCLRKVNEKFGDVLLRNDTHYVIIVLSNPTSKPLDRQQLHEKIVTFMRKHIPTDENSSAIIDVYIEKDKFKK